MSITSTAHSFAHLYAMHCQPLNIPEREIALSFSSSSLASHFSARQNSIEKNSIQFASIFKSKAWICALTSSGFTFKNEEPTVGR